MQAPPPPNTSPHVSTLPPLWIPGHLPSSQGNEGHPLRIMARRAAGLDRPAWDADARRAVAGLFDSLAEQWHTRSSPQRLAVVRDAMTRGFDALIAQPGGTAVEIGSGLGAYSDLVSSRSDLSLAIEISEEMLRGAPAGPSLRVLADAAVLPLAERSVDTVVIINSFLFPAELDRVLIPGGVIVWVSSSGAETPIHLSTQEVVAALPFAVEGVESAAGVGTWCALRRTD